MSALNGRETGLPGLLRAFVVFHQAEPLGAGLAVTRALGELEELGWTASGWFPEPGLLIEMARPHLASVAHAPKPLAVSVRGWRAPPGALARVRRSPAYLRALRAAMLRVRPHVVHANTLLSLPEATLARSLGLPVVLYVHELPPPSWKRTATLRSAAAVADVLVAVSEEVRRMLEPYAGRTPVVTVLNGVPPPLPAAPVEQRPWVIGTVGSVAARKGTDVYLRAAALALQRRPGLRFEHVGPTAVPADDPFLERVRRLSAEPGAAGRTAMLGYQPGVEAVGRWRAYVSASRQEPFGLAIGEAMAAGLPVIATRVGGVPELVRHLENGVLVPAEDAGAIADWIVRLHDDPQLGRRLGSAAAAHVRASFTLSTQALGMHRAYLAALNLRFAPPPVVRTTRRALAPDGDPGRAVAGYDGA